MDQKNIVILGKPLSKARPRFRRNGGSIVTYNSQSKEEKFVGWKLKEAYGKEKPLSGPVDLTVLFVFERPKSNKDDNFHVGVPDIDNLLKFICDAANGILWEDDRQIARAHTTKIYGDTARTIITIREIFDGE